MLWKKGRSTLRILIDEFVTGGAWYATGDAPPPESLLDEGGAMLHATAADFAALRGARVEVTRDVRLGPCQVPGVTTHVVRSARQSEQIARSRAAGADWTLIIAPEFNGHLLGRCRLVEQAGGRLLGPAPPLVRLASDKQATIEHLAAHGIPVPTGIRIVRGDRLPDDALYPAVLKPCDGAGSLGVRLIDSPGDLSDVADCDLRLETFCAGTPASVAILCGPRGMVPLMGCRQHIEQDGSFAYQGGSLPLEPMLAKRAVRLAMRAVETLESPFGYIGVDLVLGHDPRGAQDVVIEINPRVTTSYVGLRALCVGNLAAAMIAVAEGEQVELSWNEGPLQFEAAGRVWSGNEVAI